MTHVHYYIAAGSILDESTKIYQVAVGSSKQATRDYLALVAYAVDHGHYFELRNHETIEFMTKVLHSMSNLKPTPVMQRVTARELIRSLRASTALPISPSVLANRHHLNYMLDVDYRLKR